MVRSSTTSTTETRASAGDAPASSRSSTSANNSSESIAPAVAFARLSLTLRRSSRPTPLRKPGTKPLCENSHGPSVNGAVLFSLIGMPGDAFRTAASRAFVFTSPAMLANDASSHIGVVVR